MSPTISLKVLRNFDFKDVSKKTVTVAVRYSPGFGKKNILVQKKKGKGFATFKKVKTDQKGRARISVPGSSKGITYQLVAPKDKRFVATKQRFVATRF